MLPKHCSKGTSSTSCSACVRFRRLGQIRGVWFRQKVEGLSQSQKVEKWKCFILNSEKSKSPFFNFPKHRMSNQTCSSLGKRRPYFPSFHSWQHRVVQIICVFHYLCQWKSASYFPFVSFLKHPICAVLYYSMCGISIVLPFFPKHRVLKIRVLLLEMSKKKDHTFPFPCCMEQFNQSEYFHVRILQKIRVLFPFLSLNGVVQTDCLFSTFRGNKDLIVLLSRNMEYF